RAIGVILGGEVTRRALAARDALLDRRTCLHFLDVRLLVAAAALEQVIEGRHDADADGVVMLGDVPPPALAVGGLDDHRGALVAARVAVSALPVRPDGALVQHRIPLAQFEPAGEYGTLAAGIHDHLGAHLVLRVTLLNAHADGSVVLEED